MSIPCTDGPIKKIPIVTGINQEMTGFLKGMPSAVFNTNVKFLKKKLSDLNIIRIPD